jgi:formamidopyrimidine-DNA glycosylase
MPELPDVEGFKRHFARYATGRRVREVDVRDPELVRNASPGNLKSALEGMRLGAPRRHGKWLIVPAGEARMLLHFGMTGLLRWTASPGTAHPHDRLVLRFAEGELRYRNMRRFGGIWLARGEGDVERATGPLGPDAAALDAERFVALFGARRGAIKAALMDQRLLAGVGNLLADETLWRAGIHPRTSVEGLDAGALRALHGQLQEVIAASNRRGRIPGDPGWLTGVRDDRTARCPRCGTPLDRATVAGRTTRWCPGCQGE